MSDRNFLADPCLKRWQFFAGIVGFSAGGAVLFIATCFVWGFCFSFLNGHGPNDFEINEVVSRIYILFWGIWLVSMVWLAVGRARDAGRHEPLWAALAIVVPLGWIVLGCLPSRGRP